MRSLPSTIRRAVPPRRRTPLSRLSRCWLGAGLLLALACSDTGQVTAPVQPDAPTFAIADATLGSKEGFYWLPPLVDHPTTTGTFDDGLSPKVLICALAGNDCDPDGDFVAAFVMGDDGATGQRIELTGERYHVDWHVGDYDLTGSTRYRISVFAGDGVLLGFADVEPLSTGGQVRIVDADEYVDLVDDRTLPIEFRVEEGLAAYLQIEPGEPSVPLGETQQLTATLRDLHGNALGASVTWGSSDPTIARVDGSGRVTGVSEGMTKIEGVADGISGFAFLTVEPEAEEEEAPEGWATVVAGGEHGCGIRTDGRTFCWGRATSGQLGRGDLLDSLRMREVEGGHQFTSLSGGLAHTCGLTAAGAALCWGLGSHGQLGDGGAVDRRTPVHVLGGHTFASISAGYFHTCGLTTDGEGLCWGRGITGELGHGISESSSVPTAVVGGHTFASIDAGGSNSCGVTTDGEAFCWGDRFFGAVGDSVLPSAGPAYTPSPVIVDVSFLSVKVGQSFTCGVTTDFVAYCWGADSQGRLGNGSSLQSLPQPVLGGHSFASIAPGRIHTCAATPAGAAYCWGSGTFGQLGYGVPGMETSPVPVADGHEFVSISAGDYHTCGVTASAEAYCWGRGTSGQLGTGFSANQWRPERVREPPVPFPFF